MPIRSRIAKAKLPPTDRLLEVRSADDVLSAFEAHRVEVGLSKNQVALQAGYARKNYEAWARGDIVSPNIHTLLDYAQVIGIRMIIGRKR